MARFRPKDDITAIASGRHHIDAFVRRYIHENLLYRGVRGASCDQRCPLNPSIAAADGRDRPPQSANVATKQAYQTETDALTVAVAARPAAEGAAALCTAAEAAPVQPILGAEVAAAAAARGLVDWRLRRAQWRLRNLMAMGPGPGLVGRRASYPLVADRRNFFKVEYGDDGLDICRPPPQPVDLLALIRRRYE